MQSDSATCHALCVPHKDAPDYYAVDGGVNDLSNPDVLPTWMRGKVFIDGPIGFGEARGIELFFSYSDHTDVDTENRTITFTLSSGDINLQ